jgi:coproporphyrinogen III oxidase
MKHVAIVANTYEELHQTIFNTLKNRDKKIQHTENRWKNELGKGITCVLENGNIIEKAGVNFSFVKGILKEELKDTLQIETEKELKYAATGISSIIHSSNPFVPTIHFNVRFFELSNGLNWFGGGIDLSPVYIDFEEAKQFHSRLKDLCDNYDKSYYSEFKLWADDYFFLPHRNETRGVGGIFFDRLKTTTKTKFDGLYNFTKSLAQLFPDIYIEILNNKEGRKYNEEHKHWQKIRRGRYVEFNLIYDRGTKFGLETGGNTESILVSLPSEVIWPYNYLPESGSNEETTLKNLKKGIDWLSIV